MSYNETLPSATALCGEESRAEPVPEGEWKPEAVVPLEDEAAAIERDSMERPLSAGELLGRLGPRLQKSLEWSAQMDTRLGAVEGLLEGLPPEEKAQIRMNAVKLWNSRRIR